MDHGIGIGASSSPLMHVESLYVSGKLRTYPSLKPTFRPKWEVSVNVNGLGEGWVGSFPETYNDSTCIKGEELAPIPFLFPFPFFWQNICLSKLIAGHDALFWPFIKTHANNLSI